VALEISDFVVLISTMMFGIVYFEVRQRRLIARLKAQGPQFLKANALPWLREAFFDRKEADGKVVYTLNADVKAMLVGVAPGMLQELAKAIKVKLPQNLPINPATGQIDMMGGVLQKMMSGKKVSLEDFLPMIIEKAMPFIENLIGGVAGVKKPGAGGSTQNPFLKDLTQ